MTAKKIKIMDNDDLRNKIESIYEVTNQVILSEWSMEIAKHIIKITDLDVSEYPEITESFKVIELWQQGQAGTNDVRKAGFAIHKTAREQGDELTRTVFRIIGQAVSSGHMKEHSMVASDYAIKVINLMNPNDIDKVAEERRWQLNTLTQLLNRPQ